jgi:signal transduction histidine kinase
MTREWVRSEARPLPPSEVERLKNEALAELASRLAHQLGNLLQVVNGNLELIAQRTTDETTLRYLANARNAAEQLTELTRTLPTDAQE